MWTFELMLITFMHYSIKSKPLGYLNLMKWYPIEPYVIEWSHKKRKKREKNAVIQSMQCHTMIGNKIKVGTWVQASLNQLLYIWHMAHGSSSYLVSYIVDICIVPRIFENMFPFFVFDNFRFFLAIKRVMFLRLASISIFNASKRKKSEEKKYIGK